MTSNLTKSYRRHGYACVCAKALHGGAEVTASDVIAILGSNHKRHKLMAHLKEIPAASITVNIINMFSNIH